MSGWIKLHRKFCEKAFYSKDSEKVHLWVHLLMSAQIATEIYTQWLSKIKLHGRI